MYFHQIFPSCQYIHSDKHLFLITKQIYLNSHHKGDIYLETFQLIHLLIFSIFLCIFCICRLIYYFLTQQNSINSVIFILSIHDLHSMVLKILDILSTSSDNEVDINLKLSINLSLYIIVLP